MKTVDPKLKPLFFEDESENSDITSETNQGSCNYFVDAEFCDEFCEFCDEILIDRYNHLQSAVTNAEKDVNGKGFLITLYCG